MQLNPKTIETYLSIYQAKNHLKTGKETLPDQQKDQDRLLTGLGTMAGSLGLILAAKPVC